MTVFDRTGAQSAVLGTFVAGTSDDASPDDSGHHRNSGRESSDDTQRQGDDDGDGEGKFAVPDSIPALELGRIVIADSGGIEMLVGDFSDISNTVTGHFSAHVLAEHGGDDDDASGVADIKGRVRRGRGQGRFTLTGQNLPPSTVLTIVINGEDKGEVRTNRRGRLHVRRNHRTLDVFSISTVSVRDDSGGEVLKAQF